MTTTTSIKWERLQRIVLWVLVMTSLGFSLYSFRTTRKREAQAIVYVDALKLMSQYAGMKEAQANLAKRTAEYTANLDTLRSEVRTLLNGSAGHKADKAVLEAKQQTLMNYEQAVAQKYKEENEKISAELLSKVNTFIKRYGEKQGYTIIMAATHYGNIAYGDKSLDITDQVLSGLNAEYNHIH